MKKLFTIFLLGIVLGPDLCTNVQAFEIVACPRCRRAAPKGPKKKPHPGFKKKEIAPQAKLQKDMQ